MPRETLILGHALALAALSLTLHGQKIYQAPYGEGGTWNVYEVVSDPLLTWLDAEVASRTYTENLSGQNKPGHLVSIHSTEEADFVRVIAQGASVWIGLTDNESYGGIETTSNSAESSKVPPTTGRWVWVTGEPYTFARWNAGEPNDWENGNPGEDGVEMYNNGLFNDNASGIAPEGTGTTRAYVIEYETRLANKLAGVPEGPPSIMPPNLPGVVPGANGTWNLRVYRDSGFGAECSVPAAVGIVQEGLGETTDGTSFVINHWEPGSGLCDAANLLFGNKEPFPGDAEGAQDNFVMLAKTTISVTDPGDYTIGVQSDDSFAIRVHGGQFISASGNGVIDLADDEVLYYSAGTCNSNSRGVCRFPAVGQYVIEFVYYECTGNADVELYWAKGAFVNNSDTTAWKLLGNPGGVPPTLPAGPLPGPEGCDGLFGIRAIRDAGEINNIAAAVAALSNAQATIVDTTSPVVHFNDLDGTQGNAGLFPGDLPLPGNQEGDDNNFVVVAKGRINITVGGPYTFGVHTDDGFALRIRGQVWTSKSGDGAIDVTDPTTLAFPGGTGDSNTRGIVTLAPGEYDLEFLWFENGGGAFAELYAAQGAFPCDTDTRTWSLVGYKATTPPETKRDDLGVTAAGWTVEYSAPGGSGLNSIANAEAELAGASTVSNVPRIQYRDPQAGGGGSICSLPFPQDTPADDEDFAIRATAQLAIPADGTYHIGFQGDDGGYLQIEGQTWDGGIIENDEGSPVVNGDRIEFDANTGNSRTVGAITLTAGTYTIRTLFWERGGGAYHWVFGGLEGNPRVALRADGATAVAFADGLPLVCKKAALSIVRTGNNVTINWTPTDAVLQSASVVTGPYSDVVGATSPYTTTASAAQQYFRARTP